MVVKGKKKTYYLFGHSVNSEEPARKNSLPTVADCLLNDSIDMLLDFKGVYPQHSHYKQEREKLITYLSQFVNNPLRFDREVSVLRDKYLEGGDI